MKPYVCGHRVTSPEATLARYEHHVSPISGSVSYLFRVENDSDVLHSYIAGHNFAMDTLDLRSLRKGLRSKSSGKGATDVPAKASALCEAIERYSGLFSGDQPRRTDTLRSLGDAAINPNDCMLFSDRQYEGRDVRNVKDSFFHFIPEPFDDNAELEWSPLWSFTEQRFKYLPTSYLYYSYPLAGQPFYCGADSNGNAAGNTFEEAVLQGFMELVERDSVALWWHNRVRRPAVDLDSFAIPYVREMLRVYREDYARELWVIDVTSDLQIPAFAALTRRIDKPVEDIIMAFGAHFDPDIALLRALTEANQFLPAVAPIQQDGSGDYAFHDAEAIEWWKTATLENQPYLLSDPDLPAVKREDFACSWHDDLREDILVAQDLIESKGLELLVLD